MLTWPFKKPSRARYICLLVLLQKVLKCDKCEDISQGGLGKSLVNLSQLLTLLCTSKFLAICLSGVNCLAYDEAIIAQQDRIQQEVRRHWGRS